MKKKDLKLSIIGLGYVGLPLAIEFSRKRSVLGFDINQQRIRELESGNVSTLETTQEEIFNIIRNTLLSVDGTSGKKAKKTKFPA